MVRSMLSWSPSERPEAADITGTPLFQELELPCRLAMRQRSRTYSASSMGRPSRQTSTTWKSHDAICKSPCFPFIPLLVCSPRETPQPPRRHTLPQTFYYDKCAVIYLCGFRAARQSPAQTHMPLHVHTPSCCPILITLTSERIF